MPTIEANGIHINYEIHGDGEPLMLIGGFGVGLWVWSKQVPALSQQFKTIIFDNRGAGQSDKPEERHTVRTMADDAAGLLTALGIERVHVLGASLGGFIAQEFALGYPQMTNGLVLACTSFGGPNHVPPPDEVLMAVSGMEGMHTEERARQNLQYFFSPSYAAQHPEEVERMVQLYVEHPMPEHSFINQLIAAMAFDADARVGHIATPALIITGNQDEFVPPENSRNLADKIPNARLALIENAGHAVFIEQAEEFNRTVIEFLASVNKAN